MEKILFLDLVSPYEKVIDQGVPSADVLPTEFRLFHYGMNRAWHMDEGDREIEFSKEDAARLMAGYLDAGVELPIDWEHQMVDGSSAPKPAAGWFRPEIREDGLYATDVRWTPKAQDMLKNREYRYFSPTIHFDEDGKMDRLLPAALTNLPALKDIKALMNSIVKEKDKKMSDDKLETLSATETLAQMTAEKLKIEKELQELKVDQMLHNAIAEGRLTPAKKDELKKQVAVLGLSGLKTVLDLLPVQVTTQRAEEISHIAAVQKNPDELTDFEKKVARSIGVTFEAFSAQKKITAARQAAAKAIGNSDTGAAKHYLLANSIDNTAAKAKAEQITCFSASGGYAKASMKLVADRINVGYAVTKQGENKE